MSLSRQARALRARADKDTLFFKAKFLVGNIGKPDVEALSDFEKQVFFDTLFSCIEEISKKEDSENQD